MARQRYTELSGYKFMWVMVLFDLPTATKKERYHYTKFRNFLLDNAFEMAQYSVYVRHTSGKDAVQAIIRKIERAMPPMGKVDILQFTDKQYENIVCFRGNQRRLSLKNPEQFILF
ncbi:CRISPR-associated endonuclease Cas2 [Sneathiella limimaris]|uniref:CRISPR-associated endonuclease Cas2 n=1 Tax=Sneathiella limimaris TaxID=1964213 RepID=UPI0019D049CB|nr:CRISPR-associated endonuclease Cas2 [Sneathiella limimaris]